MSQAPLIVKCLSFPKAFTKKMPYKVLDKWKHLKYASKTYMIILRAKFPNTKHEIEFWIEPIAPSIAAVDIRDVWAGIEEYI